ncbi:MAG: hypothetical protein EAZ53_11080 [Bacteroidetes bacterium]|nr:MAG: hypothetical protein EAZ53_11080 [Bacteroidota bacterium]
MKVIQTNRFLNDFSNLEESQKNIIATFVNNLIDSDHIDITNYESIVGFPYIHKIDFFEKYIVFYFSTHTNTIELSGIVPKGNELTLFF